MRPLSATKYGSTILPMAITADIVINERRLGCVIRGILLAVMVNTDEQ
jgi:hypothetical protein